MRPTYISPELSHFVGRADPLDHERNFGTLKKVLESGCISHAPHVVGWGTVSHARAWSQPFLEGEDLLVPTVTCYCDIPAEQMAPHVRNYGSFGLSFPRHRLIKYGARPVIYMPMRPDDWAGAHTGETHLRELKATLAGLQQQIAILTTDGNIVTKKRGLGQMATTLIDVLSMAENVLASRVIAFVKPYDSILDEADPRYYYSEREWRKYGNLMFDPLKDVSNVLVHESYVDRAKQQWPLLAARIRPALPNPVE